MGICASICKKNCGSTTHVHAAKKRKNILTPDVAHQQDHFKSKPSLSSNHKVFVHHETQRVQTVSRLQYIKY